MRPWLAFGAVAALLVVVHAVASWSSGGVLPDDVRRVVGGSSEARWANPWSSFTGPFFHDHVGHLAYNLVLFTVGLPPAVRAFGPRALFAAYAASPLVGVTLDAALLLPLARAGHAGAASSAAAVFVGASVVAYALVGMAVVAWAARVGRWGGAGLVALVVAYEAALAALGVTRPFVWAYHLGGLAVGMAAGVAFASGFTRGRGARRSRRA